MVFSTFFNFSLNLAIRSSWSEPQSAPGLVFADCIELLHLWLQRNNQFDFCVDHLVMSMCKVFSCIVGRGCLLWPMCSLGRTLLSQQVYGLANILQDSPGIPASFNRRGLTFLYLFMLIWWRRKWQPTPVFLPGESWGQRSLVGCHAWSHTESDTTEAT